MLKNTTNSGESPSTESILNAKLMDSYNQLYELQNDIVIDISDEDSLSLNITKEELAIKVRNYIQFNIHHRLVFEKFDNEWNIYFCISEYEFLRREGVSEIMKTKKSLYYDKFQTFLVSNSEGIFIGEVFEVKVNDKKKTEQMVRYLHEYNRSFCGTYGELLSDYIIIKHLASCIHFGPLIQIA